MHRPHATLRQKPKVDLSRSDREIFELLSIDDVWEDAGLLDVYRYARRGMREHIPGAWVDTLETLDSQLEALGHEV